jgi:hypothetical protein
VFERYTDRARKVVVLAQEEARALSHNYIGTEHILLGLIHEGEGVAAKALESLDISLEAVRAQVEEIAGQGQQAPSGHIPFTPRAKKVLDLALREALQLGHSYIGTEHILLGLIREGKGVAAQVLQKLGADINRVRQQVIQLLSLSQEGTVSEPPEDLGPYRRDITREARDGRLDPVVGRDREIERLFQVLTLRTPSCPVLTGEAGLSVMAVLEGAAQLMARSRAGELFDMAELHYLDLVSLVRSEPEDRIGKEILNAVRSSVGGSGVVAISGLPTATAASTERSAEISRMLRESVVNGELRAIFMATPDEFREALELDPDLGPLLKRLDVAEPSESTAIEMLKGLRDRFEAHHRVTIIDEALVAAVMLAKQYSSSGYLPETAIELLDEAGSRFRTRRAMNHPSLEESMAEVEEVRFRKEAAIDGQDFEAGARLRDEEKRLLARHRELEERWREGDLDEIAEIDEDLVVEVVADRMLLTPQEVRNSLDGVFPEDVNRGDTRTDSPKFRFLNDVPLAEHSGDPLGMTATAMQISRLLETAPAPFALAIDATWGSGKSSLLYRVEELLVRGKPATVPVRFNAWTAQGDNALEALIKSVLQELDPSILRRNFRRAAKRQHVWVVVRIFSTLVARFVGISRLVDELWSQLGGDTAARNELRKAIHGMLTEWSANDAGAPGRKSLVVFIDDLDRCTDEVVVQVCEAVKLYLDAPGLIFVLACDMSVIARGVGHAARGGTGEGRIYLEKIVQVAYRLPPPDRAAVTKLVGGYGTASGTRSLLTPPVVDILIERGGGNPRRIKRIINSFVLENSVNDAWGRGQLTHARLVSVIILQHLYPEFYEWLVREGAHDDPVGDFLDYASFRQHLGDSAVAGDRWWSETAKLFRRHGLTSPRRRKDSADLTEFVGAIDRTLPETFPLLAGDDAFLALLKTLGGPSTRAAVRAQLLRRPLTSGAASMTESALQANTSTPLPPGSPLEMLDIAEHVPSSDGEDTPRPPAS